MFSPQHILILKNSSKNDMEAKDNGRQQPWGYDRAVRTQETYLDNVKLAHAYVPFQ